MTQLLMSTRTKSSIFPRRRGIASQNGSSGTIRSQRPLGCMCAPPSLFLPPSRPEIGDIGLVNAFARYAVSLLIHRALWFMNGACSETSLRMTNWVAIIVLIFTAVDCRRLIETRLAERRERRLQPSSLSFYAIHTGMNIGLFPLLFFFSALYYTDVFSTLMVLFAFQNHLERVATKGKPWRNDFFVIFLGVASLFMRQTNVFWVVVFMGGLEAVEAVKAVPAAKPQPPSQGDLMTDIKYFARRSSLGEIHDPALNQASLDGQYLPKTLRRGNFRP